VKNPRIAYLRAKAKLSNYKMKTEESQYHAVSQKLKDAEQSQMFGKPCYKINGKAFVSFFNDAMVFKLEGKAHKEAISLKGAQLFDPSGKKRPMKEWVQVPYEHQQHWGKFAREAMRYVSGK
jgi:hypothetical protein